MTAFNQRKQKTCEESHIRGHLNGSNVSMARQLDLELPQGNSNKEWLCVGARSPSAGEVMIVKRTADGWMGFVAGLHNDREIVAMVFQIQDQCELIPMLQDGMDRRSGLTHWRPWPTVNLPSLVAHLV